MSSQSSITEIKSTYRWQPRAANIWVSREPHNALQTQVLHRLRERLEARGCIFVEALGEETELGPETHLGIAFGRDLEEEISPLELLGQLPKPRGMMLVINAVERIPSGNLFDVARGQLVRKAGHIGMTFEGDLNGTRVKRVLWASMAGNNRMLEGDEDAIFDGLALRVQAHMSAERVNVHAGDEDMPVTWEAWAASPIHADIARAARALGQAGIIEDEVPLAQYASSDQTRSVLRFLKRASLGEGMRSQLDLDLGVMGITTSGGNKINVSPDPNEGHVVPLRQLTWDGYIRSIPQGCPVTFIPPSVETHENGMLYLAGALVNAGLVDSFESFFTHVAEHFAHHERLDILPDGMQPKAVAIEHFHRQPRAGSVREPDRVEVVYPDTSLFPEIDFPCGVREAELHLLSAVFRAESFRKPGPLGRRMVMAVLPGHGSVALYGGPRDELTDLLVNGMELEEIVRV